MPDFMENTGGMYADKLEQSRSRSPSGENRSRRSRDYSKEGEKFRRRSRSRSSSKHRDGKRDRSSSRDRDRHRRHSKDRSRHSPRDRRHRRSRSKSYDVDERRRRSPARRGGRGRSPPWRRTTRLPGPERRDVMFFEPKAKMPEGINPNMTAEERDERTVFILQLARNTRPTDLEEFFSSVGPVRDVRIITDSRTGRSKGIAYVEFWEREAVAMALGLNKQRLLGAPLVIQPSGAERNRQAAQTLGGALGFSTTFSAAGPLKLVVENLHPDINDKMLLDIFEPFGKISICRVARDDRRQSKGYANLCFRSAEDAKKVLEQMNGYEIAGRPLRIKIDEEDQIAQPIRSDPMKFDQNTDQASKQDALGGKPVTNVSNQPGYSNPQPSAAEVPSYATQCFLLSNMFDPTKEVGTSWPEEVADDVITECSRHGGVLHLYVDRNSKEGYVYVKCPSVSIAHHCVMTLHGRFFAGKLITANYVPLGSYHDLFPESVRAVQPLKPRYQ